MGPAVGLDPAAAGEQGANRHPLLDIQPAGSLGAQEALVPGKAEDINAHFLHVDGEHPCRLGGIHQK